MKHKNEKDIDSPPRDFILEWVRLGLGVQKSIHKLDNVRRKGANLLGTPTSTNVQLGMEEFKTFKLPIEFVHPFRIKEVPCHPPPARMTAGCAI